MKSAPQQGTFFQFNYQGFNWKIVPLLSFPIRGGTTMHTYLEWNSPGKTRWDYQLLISGDNNASNNFNNEEKLNRQKKFPSLPNRNKYPIICYHTPCVNHFGNRKMLNIFALNVIIWKSRSRHIPILLTYFSTSESFLVRLSLWGIIYDLNWISFVESVMTLTV